MNNTANPSPENRELVSFFGAIAAVVRISKQAQAELDLRAATRFSVFKYFKENENALSDIFADMLDPHGSHGQGAAFMRLFPHFENNPVLLGSAGEYRIIREKRIDNNRRVDIVIDCPHALVGIENKPWAVEQEGQLSEYRDYLRNEAKGRCWALLYLSGDGKDSETIGEDREHYFKIPYRTESANSSASIESWFTACAQSCEAESVRFFLRDCLRYIREEFSVHDGDDEEN